VLAVPEQFFCHKLTNGLTVLAQPMPSVSSAAMSVMTPAGASHDPADQAGAASVMINWFLRGAGGRNTRQLHEALDSLGCQHSEAVHSEHIMFAAAQLGRNLMPALDLYADILRRPSLEDASFEPCRALTVQDLSSLEDEPAQKCTILLRENFYPWPLGRCVYGSQQTLSQMQADQIRAHVEKNVGPVGTILASAGNLDWDKLLARIEDLFGDWPAQSPPAVQAGPAGQKLTYIHKDSAQTHIGLAHPTVPIGHPQYYPARMACTVLSGGMASRLFTEVREKRGLVYHVSARYHTLKDFAGIFTYAGTTPQKAKQTLEVTIEELRRLGRGISEQELNRAKTQLKSALVMQGESTSARASSIASDWHTLGRIRTLDEISRSIDAVSIEQVMEHLHDWPARNFTVLVIGPESLDTRCIGE